MELAQRIQRLEAIEAIRALKAKYLNACDLKQLEEIRSCFVERDLFLDYGVIGQFDHVDQLIEVFDRQGNHPHIFDSHHGCNAEIDILSNTQAKARWALAFVQLDQEQKIITRLAGFYQDEYSYQDGRWLISRSEFVVNSTWVSQLDEKNQLNCLVLGLAS